MRRLLLAAAFSIVALHVLAAQRPGGVDVQRPRLRDVVDTNDAKAYYDLGLDLFEHDSKQAAAAFHWAARINPAWGEPLYARRAALLMDQRVLLRKTFDERGRPFDTPGLRSLDSLQFRALMLSPFLYRELDYAMFRSVIREDAVGFNRARGVEDPSIVLLDAFIEEYLRAAGPYRRAWLSYAKGDFAAALRDYQRAYEVSRDGPGVRLERARIFGMRKEVDSAVREMQLARAELEKREGRERVFYETVALTEYSAAVLLEGAGRIDAARDGYVRALQADPSYHSAHMRLGLLSLGTHDTTAALSELALAAKLAPDEPFIRYTNGWALGVARRYPDAIAELRTVLELDPHFALPYLRLGQIHELMGHFAEAAGFYQGFVDRASRLDAQREYATERLAEVREALSIQPRQR
jgi:tetratricopeptide (TPR) repeat protein